ncbi:MAG: hypothetical protein ACYDHP_04285 [Ferrimicrobium sp.]
MSTTHTGDYSATHEKHPGDSATTEAIFFERRAKVGVLLLILSDAMMVIAAFASFLYLRALNTSDAFKPPGEHAPALAGGLIVALLIVLGAIVFHYQVVPSARSGGDSGVRSGLSLALLLATAALVVQAWAVATGFSFPTPVHAYASALMLLGVIGLVHMFLTAMITLLVFGRSKRGFLGGHSYALEAVGYWWYYVAGLTVVAWLLVTFL